METFHKYPELVRLEKRPEILSVKQVVATEKLHGSNFRVCFPGGMTSIAEVRFGGRHDDFGTGEESFYGGRAVGWFKQRPELLERMLATFGARGFFDVIVYGEICGTAVQKGVRYAAPGEIFFRAFDICVGQNFMTYDLFVELCEEMQLQRVPEVWRGEPSLEAFDALLEKNSQEGVLNGVDGENVSEGVVIRSNPLLRNVFGEWLIIKHKSAKFAEVAAAKPQKVRADSSVADELAEKFVVRGRLVNALGRLRDSGVRLAGDLRDMPLLIPAMVADLQKECAPEWQAALAAGSEKQLRGAVTKRLGAVYRELLSEES